ncbi:sensor histidine kinase [Nitrincola tapanii]|uniref:histidine kinase n=1 Tax=Nitrincola tapanii TaxID=1708751 RepID=A0A5A9W4M8_9GAMM|nr:HAMP domain-containing sensor histidine kinase [Nitrincola tapanii]KAA0875028.1 HAMP domain-containing histidine kinase [Nitrincola tapanii]
MKRWLPPKQTKSLQKQLMIRLACLLICLWLLGLVLATLVVRHVLNQSLDSALQETAERILPLAILELYNRDQLGVLQQLPALRAHDEYLTYRVLDASGQVLVHSHGAREEQFVDQFPLPQGFVNHGDYRVFITSAIRETFFIQVAEPLTARQAAILSNLLALALPLLLILPLSLFVATWLVHKVLFPLRAYGLALAQRSAVDLTPVDIADLPLELSPIVKQMNGLMERLHKALTAERYFTANAAHELRTPLATAIAQLQRLQKKLTDEEARSKADQVRSSLGELVTLTDKLLQLAKAEGSSLLVSIPQDLSSVLRMLVNEFQITLADRLVLVLPKQPVMSPVDIDAFALLVRNLLENAMKHGDPIQRIQIELKSDATLSFINQCEVVQAEQLNHLHERFYRGLSETSGSGLGLAIATALVQGMGGEIQLYSPVPGQAKGFEVRVKLPNLNAST